jgi:hypothetical protein
LGDSHAVFVAISLTMCLKKEKNRPWTKEGYIKRPQYTQENLTRDLVANEPNDYKFFLRWHGPLFDKPSAIVTPTVTKRNTNM